MISDCRFQTWDISYLPRAGGVDCHLRFKEFETFIFFRRRHHTSGNTPVPLSLDTTFSRQYTLFIR